MRRTLHMGSRGLEVSTLQSALNLLPSALVRLGVDSIFGPKTYGRVTEFQRSSRLVQDGIVGRMTWQAIEAIFGGLIDYFEKIRKINRTRDKIVQAAHKEFKTATIRAMRPNGKDPHNGKTLRVGSNHLLKYFRIAAPSAKNPKRSLFDEDAIAYLKTPGTIAPMPSWCGIFALWATKAAGVQVGTWKIGRGIASVRGFSRTKHPMKGDIGYVHSPVQHHFIVQDVVLDKNGVWVKSIDGNMSPDSSIRLKKRLTSQISVFYTPF